MNKLEERKYTNKEIAAWFQVGYTTYRNNKERYLEQLKDYAEYHLEGNKTKKIVIDKVLRAEYKNNECSSYDMVKNKVNEVWDESGLDSCSRVGDKIYEVLSMEADFDLQPSTVYTYTIRGRNELYGVPFVGGGSIGSCTYLWCKRDKETGDYSFLTEEEQQIKKNLQTKYFGDATEKQIMVKAMVEAGEITKEEAWGVLEEMTNMCTGNFMGFLKELQDKLHCQVVKGTLVERGCEAIECAW